MAKFKVVSAVAAVLVLCSTKSWQQIGLGSFCYLVGMSVTSLTWIEIWFRSWNLGILFPIDVFPLAAISNAFFYRMYFWSDTNFTAFKEYIFSTTASHTARLLSCVCIMIDFFQWMETKPATKLCQIFRFLGVFFQFQFVAKCVLHTGSCILIAFWNLTHWGRDKWPPFSRRHFQMHFLEWKCINFD